MSHLTNALPIVAAAYAERFAVPILIQGNDAYTNGTSIVIPSADYDDPHYQTVAWGFLSHEAAHLRYSDFNVIKGLSQSPLRKSLVNILEDVRIERALAHDFPGTQESINATMQYLINEGNFHIPPHLRLSELLQYWVLIRLRYEHLKQAAMAKPYERIRDYVNQVLPELWQTRLSEIMDEVRTCQSTTDVITLADRLLAAWEQLTQSPTIAPPPSTQAPPRTTQEHHHPHEPSQKALNAKTSVSGSETSPTDTRPNPTNTQSSTQDALTLNPDDDPIPDLFNQVSDLLKDIAQQSPKRIQGATTILPAEPADRGSSDLLFASAIESAKLRYQVRGLIQSSHHQRVHPSRIGRRVLTSRLARAAFAEERLFTQQRTKLAPNAAIHVLVDCSSSMKREIVIEGSKRSYADIANRAALALAMALDGIKGVSLEVSYFPAKKNGHAVTSVLSSDQQAQSRAAYFDQPARGRTPLTPAIWYAAQALLQKKEKRKVLMVITDGEPDNQGAAQNIINRCEASGFDVIGIGIATQSVADLFKHHLIIKEVNQLKTALMGITKDLLVNQQRLRG